jgi:lipoate-protein ligase A
MVEQWRLILTGHKSAYYNMALDEAIMKLSHNQEVPTMRFYGWTPAAISIGYFQGMRDEVDIEKCNEYGVDVVRRITGGGAVFHDQELTYSFVATEVSGILPKNILDSYRKICGGVIAGLGKLDLNASFVPLNDIVVAGKKISGNAQTRREKAILQHGTILAAVDVEKMFSLLKVPNEKLKGKLIEDVKQRVTSIEQQLGKKVSFEQTLSAMKKGFEENFGVKLKESKPTKEEAILASEIMAERFANDAWNFRR